MNCTNCGAPLKVDDEKCQYCGSITPYGEQKLQERRQHEREEQQRQSAANLPAMKYVSMTFAVCVYLITFGYYAPYWYATRIAQLNGLGTSKKFPAWAAGVFGLACLGMFILPGWEGYFGVTEEFSQEVVNYSLGIAFVVSVYLAFAVRGMLQEHAAKFMDRGAAVQTIAPSGLSLVLFGPLYLQACINRMIAMKMLAPKI